ALMSADQFEELAGAAINRDAVTLQAYGNQAGYPALRTQLAGMYKVAPEQVLIGGEGSLQLLDLLAQQLLADVPAGMNPLVLVEQPSYDRAITTFLRHGARVIGVPLEDDGISVEGLESAIAKQGAPSFIYLVPDSQNPTGVTLSAAKRKLIVALAAQHGFTIIEDIPYRHLRYTGEPQPMLRELDDRHVVTISSFSKLIAPGLRVGYAVSSQETIAALVKLAEDTYISPPLLNQAIVSEFLSRDLLEDQVSRLVRLYTPRWQAAMAAVRLLGGRVYAADGGFMIGVELPAEAKVAGLVERAKDAGVAVTPGRLFYAESLGDIDPDRFLRLPFCALTEDEFAEGIKRLASIL
ncbi:MAG TPA: PLP-dependent aminotransferase family protein, partial [Candidatus Polarisedimenticolaceae bacterium]|nr:PLP-dependent aminotransferase family protein [Candidatus Polarisedimenticolaceae bacterium]